MLILLIFPDHAAAPFPGELAFQCLLQDLAGKSARRHHQGILPGKTYLYTVTYTANSFLPYTNTYMYSDTHTTHALTLEVT